MNEKEKLNSDICDLAKVTIYQNRQKQISMMTEEQIPGLDPNNFGLFIDLLHRLIVVHKPNGDEIRHEEDFAGLSWDRLSLLFKLMRVPGRYRVPYEIGRMDPQITSHYIKSRVISTLSQIKRLLFHEPKGTKSHFLLVKTPFEVAYNKEVSYCLIVRPEETSHTAKSHVRC